jgi:hypothetical protein
MYVNANNFHIATYVFDITSLNSLYIHYADQSEAVQFLSLEDSISLYDSDEHQPKGARSRHLCGECKKKRERKREGGRERNVFVIIVIISDGGRLRGDNEGGRAYKSRPSCLDGHLTTQSQRLAPTCDPEGCKFAPTLIWGGECQ